jgi:uncharacterized membrane protein YdjX (TVP38/TMEM64 family)
MNEPKDKVRMNPNRLRRIREAALFAVLLAIIVVPFLLFEETLLAWVASLRDGGYAAAAVALAFVGLLVADILAPVPSSLVGVALGASFGSVSGTLLVWLGLTGGTLIGYAAGRRLGRPLVRASVGGRDLAGLDRLVARHGLWALAFLRAVPVMAEASVILAGAGALRFRAFLAVMALSNLGVAFVYAQIGVFGVEAGSMGLAMAGAMALPALAWLIQKAAGHARGAAGGSAGGPG